MSLSDKPKMSLEVITADPFTKQRIIACYKGEIYRDANGYPSYKCYSPFFTGSKDANVQLEAFRWTKSIKVIGTSPTDEEVRQHLLDSTYTEEE